jgi:hypothetical protein
MAVEIVDALKEGFEVRELDFLAIIPGSTLCGWIIIHTRSV